jgi:hypothetical protein
MSEIINQIAMQGVDIDTAYLILALPFIATLITVFRQVIGIKSFGIYTPLVLTFAFWATGLKYGLAIFTVILVTGTAVRYLLKSFKLLYLPRMAIVITAISVATLITLAVGGSMSRTGLSSTPILAILILITLIEKFISTQVEKGIRTAALLSIETLIISTVGYYFIIWDKFRDFVLDHPEYIIFLFIINIFLGRWTGLRLSEYIRFKNVYKNIENE